jgi:translation initiation factor 2 subunit 1
MSLLVSSDWPQRDELVVAVIDEIVDHGAYVKLETYKGKRGYLPISEVSQGWVTDISRFINPGQRVVLKAIRVNPTKGHIDLSMKRVTPSERNSVLRAWKRRRRFDKTIENVFESLKFTKEQRAQVLERLLAQPDPLAVIEKAASEGAIALTEAGIEPSLIPVLVEYSKRNIKLKEYTSLLKFSVSTPEKSGALKIKSLLEGIEKVLSMRSVNYVVYVVAAPNYAIEVSSQRPKLVNAVMKDIPLKLRELASGLNLTLEIAEDNK